MKRRTFFCIPVFGLFSSVPWFYDEFSDKANINNRARLVFEKLSEIFSDPINAAYIGNKYLAANPESLNYENLLFDMGIKNDSSDMNSISNFEKQRSEDYRLSNILIIDGWVLSKAEVSLCCATSLLLTNS